MPRRYVLPASRAVPHAGFLRRARHFLLRRWPGRILLAAGAVWLLERVGTPIPDFLAALARVLLFALGLYAAVSLARFTARRLLWRIRTKLLVSYLFIAVVPVVLLTLFFGIAGFLGLSLMASYMVASQVERTSQELLTVARTTLVGLDPADSRLAREVEERLAAARALHPGLQYALVQRGRAVASEGDAPRALPPWLAPPGFAGLVEGPEGERLRAAWVQGDTFLVLDRPVDDTLFADLERRTGIKVVQAGGRVEARQGGIKITRERAAEPAARAAGEPLGFTFFSFSERTDWTTGRQDLEPLAIRFQPSVLVRRLSPASLDMGDVFVKGLAVVGVLFLVVYSVALLLGLLLARSITQSIHALSRGTERLREGDFGQPIPIRSRDQLGELAESFNMMSRGIEDLLREQAEKERLEEELRIARQIQMSLLPQEAVSVPGLLVAALCLPAAEVGGDYYDLLPLSDTRLGVLVADVSGKGTSAALYMAELKGLVLSLSRIYDSPARLLGEANQILAANMDARSFITMTYAVADVGKGTMRHARAGHTPLIHLEASTGRTRVLTPPGLGLGLDRGERFEQVLEEEEVPLRSGDVFVFFTDGLSEAMNERSELFGERRLRDLVESGDSLGVDELKQRILDEVHAFVGGAAPHDDMTMVILKVV